VIGITRPTTSPTAHTPKGQYSTTVVVSSTSSLESLACGPPNLCPPQLDCLWESLHAAASLLPSWSWSCILPPASAPLTSACFLPLLFLLVALVVGFCRRRRAQGSLEAYELPSSPISYILWSATLPLLLGRGSPGSVLPANEPPGFPQNQFHTCPLTEKDNLHLINLAL
jgi:hypothetical protein